MARGIYVIGDIHGDYDVIQSRIESLKYASSTKNRDDEKDVLFVAGDAGFINSYETPTSIERRKEYYNDLPFIIIAVLGNHENYDVIEKLPTTTIFKAKCYKEDGVDILYACNGQIFDIDGTKIFTFNGGLSIDKERRLLLKAQYNRDFWWPQEIKEEDFDSAYSNYFNHQVDYVITHDVPLSIFKQIMPFINNSGKNIISPLQPFLQKIYSINKFEHWYAGHYHPSFPITIEKCTVLPIGYMEKIK